MVTDNVSPAIDPIDFTDLPALKRLYRYLLATDQAAWAAEVDDAWREIRALREKVEGLRADVDLACCVFSKYNWSGRLDMPREFHVARGRKMAGLKDEVNSLLSPTNKGISIE